MGQDCAKINTRNLLGEEKESLFKKICALILCTALIVPAFAFLQVPEAAAAAPAPDLEVSTAVLIDAETGQVLFELDKDVPRPPASMAKMMTEYLILEQIKSGKLSWEDTIVVSEYAASIKGSGSLLAPGETYTVEALFKSLSIYSGNDASVALAERIAGSEEAFAHMMNEKAREIGLSDNAYFINATGLPRADMQGKEPASLPGETMMTAHDAAKLARRIILDHPEALEFSSTTEAYLKPNDERYRMINWNWMLQGWETYNNNFTPFAYEGLDGLKTGHTKAAGYCFTGTAERNGLRLISVVMNAPTERKRFDETRKLLDYGFDNFEKKTILHPKTELEQLATVPVSKGKTKEVGVVTEQGVEFLVAKGTGPEQFTIVAEAAEEAQRTAPIQKGQVVGKVTVSYTDTGGQLFEKTVNLVASEDVEKASWFVLLMRGIAEFFKDLFNGIKNLF